MPSRPDRLLLVLSLASDRQRMAVHPALAAAATRAGWAFEAYADERRSGAHFGGGDPTVLASGASAGSLVAGGGHVEHVLWLAAAFDVVVVGDPRSLLWAPLVAAGVPARVAMTPAQAYHQAYDVLGLALPADVLVLDGQPQGPHGVCVGPYLYPELLDGPPALALEVTAAAADREALVELGAQRFSGRYLDAARATAFGPLAGSEGSVDGRGWAEVTVEIAERHRGWGRGFLLGDPGLVASQVARGASRRLLPLYSAPQTEVIARAADLLGAVGGTVFGRQYDDHDFFALAPLGHGLQLVDPGPPFESMRRRAVVATFAPPRQVEPPVVDDEQLERWADEGRVLTTLLFWSGMVRELDCVPRIVDVVAATGLSAGLVLTAEAAEQAPRPPLTLLAEPFDQGGAGGRLELLLGSLGRSVAPEALLPPGVLLTALTESRRRLFEVLPAAMQPTGWWPILDAPLSAPWPGRVHLQGRRPVVRMPPRRPPATGADEDAQQQGRPDLRGRAGELVRRAGAGALLEQERPFSWRRPSGADLAVAEAVRDAGFASMWSKAGFGACRLVHRSGDFVSVPLTAGVWGGWTPFYTVDRLADLVAAERRLLGSGAPGWLVGTIDSPLWLASGEVLQHGAALHAMAEWLVRGGRSGRLVCTTPGVIARYARLLDDRHVAGTPA